MDLSISSLSFHQRNREAIGAMPSMGRASAAKQDYRRIRILFETAKNVPSSDGGSKSPYALPGKSVNSTF